MKIYLQFHDVSVFLETQKKTPFKCDNYKTIINTNYKNTLKIWDIREASVYLGGGCTPSQILHHK